MVLAGAEYDEGDFSKMPLAQWPEVAAGPVGGGKVAWHAEGRFARWPYMLASMLSKHSAVV